MALADELDGRRLRREQNREAVIDALVELHAEGIYEPGSNLIAERAGLSPRSLFRYFDDVDDLNRAAIERQLAAAQPLLGIDAEPRDPLAARIAALVTARARLFEAIAPTARAARVCAHRHPVIAAEVEEGRAYFRRQVARLFAPELRGARRAELLPVLDVLCAFETWELLRNEQGLTPKQTAAALTAALTAQLASSP
jgi:AcrR family transcriptional regulator